MSISSGSYAAYHFYNAAAGAGDAGVTGALVRNNLTYTGAGFWPTTNDENINEIWTSPRAGITCVEYFFYLSDLNQGNQDRYLFEFKPRYDNRDTNPAFPPGSDIDNYTNVSLSMRQKRQNADLVIQLRVGSGTSVSSTSINIGTPSEAFINANEWYHGVIRYNGNANAWEFLMGNMGRDRDGAVSSSATSDLSSILNEASEDVNNGSYVRWLGKSLAGVAEGNRGPIVVAWGYRDFPLDFYQSAKAGSFTKFAILTKSEGFPTQSNNYWLDHLWQGGIADLRFWYSTLPSTRTYTQIAEIRDSAPFYQPGENSDLYHCWRFNNTGASVVATDQEDVGKYTGVIDQYDDYIQHRAGWPYDISEPNAGGEEKLFTGISIGVAEQADFYEAVWAQDSEGNPVYREAPEYPLTAHGTAGIENYVGAGIRVIAEDFYNTGDYYWFPGTGVVEFIENDDEGQEYYSLSLPDFDVEGYGALFSNIFLIDNNTYIDWINQGKQQIPYFSNRQTGPYIIVASDTAGSFSLNFVGED